MFPSPGHRQDNLNWASSQIWVSSTFGHTHFFPKENLLQRIFTVCTYSMYTLHPVLGIFSLARYFVNGSGQKPEYKRVCPSAPLSFLPLLPLPRPLHSRLAALQGVLFPPYPYLYPDAEQYKSSICLFPSQ